MAACLARSPQPRCTQQARFPLILGRDPSPRDLPDVRTPRALPCQHLDKQDSIRPLGKRSSYSTQQDYSTCEHHSLSSRRLPESLSYRKVNTSDLHVFHQAEESLL